MQVNFEPWKVNEDTNIWGVKILDGDFEGAMIAFNEFDSEDDSTNFKLDYTIVKEADGKTMSEMNGPAFDEMLNYVVNEILRRAIDEYENRNSNSTESS